MNIVGLILNICGVILLFFFGFPQPEFPSEVGLGVEDATVFADGTSVKDILEKSKKKKRVYKLMSFLALSLILLGFTLQLIAALRK